MVGSNKGSRNFLFSTNIASGLLRFRCDYSQYDPQLIRAFIMLFTSKDEIVLQQAWNALAAVTKNMDADQQVRTQ